MSASSDESKQLGNTDLVVFFGTLALAVGVGIYYAVADRKKSVDNYYFGGRSMSPIPVGFSIALTYTSAITVIGFPAETYLFGTVMFWFGLSSIIPNIVACIYYIPLIHRLQLATIYEYLEMRFERYNRQIASAASSIGLIFYMGMTIYVPSLALNAVTPLSLSTTIIISSLACTFYTALGGMKAVIWTDTMQTVAMAAGGLAAMIRALMIVGGFGPALSVADKGGRLNFWNFNPDPTIRYSAWGFLIGKVMAGCGTTCVNQSSSQRYLSCKTINRARIAALISIIPIVCLKGIAVGTGMAMYAYYEGCDPLTLGKIAKSDQMLPYLVVDVFQDLPGMAGLFVAAAYSGTLSSVSSGLNSLAILLLHDFILALKPSLSEAYRLTLSKLLVFGLGLVVMGFSLAISTFQATVLRIAFSFFGVIGGPTTGLFTLGLFFPWVTAKGALFGQACGTAVAMWIAYGSLAQGKTSHGNYPLPLSTSRCTVLFTENATTLVRESSHSYVTNIPVAGVDSISAFSSLKTTAALETTSPLSEGGGLATTLYAISFLYYAAIAIGVTVVTGVLASFLTGANDPKEADPSLFVPFIDNNYLSESIRKFFRFGVPPPTEEYKNVEKEKLNLDYLNEKSNFDVDECLDKENLTASDKMSAN